MSDNIPFEIQVEIIKRFPVKSLIQFRSVSKTWKSLIDSSDFIAHYSGQHTHMQHLLVKYYYPADFDSKYVSVADDDTFPQQKESLNIPRLVNRLAYDSIIGCSHGLLCLYGYYRTGRGDHRSEKGMAVLWNLSIRKVVAVIVPTLEDQMFDIVIGFGVCKETTDPKIVKISTVNGRSNILSTVEVFTLSTRGWRSAYGNLPRKSIRFGEQVVVDGFLYWLANGRITMDDEFSSYNLIISFDMTSEEFREINLPDSLASLELIDLYSVISKLRNSLVVLECDVDANNTFWGVWMMEDGAPKSFAKLFTVSVNRPYAPPLRGFRKSGSPIVEIAEDDGGQLVVYEPYSKHIDNFWVDGKRISFAVYPYMETLLLLDQPDLMVFN